MLNKLFIVSKTQKILQPIVRTSQDIDSFLQSLLPKDFSYEKKSFLTLESYTDTIQYTAVILESEPFIDGYNWFDIADLQDKDLRVLSWPGKYTLLLNIRKLLSGDTDVIDIYNRRKELQPMNIADFFNELNKEASQSD